MDQHTINDIVDKGERAGNKLLQEFNLDHHQWTRLRLLINELSKQARIVRGDLAITLPEADWNNIKHNLRVALTPLEGASTNVVRELIIKEWEARYPSEGQPKPFPYPSDTTSQVNLLNPSESLRLNLLLALIAIWGEEHTKHEPFFGGEKPSTERVRLRITPTL
jgi:hypothetical protein